MLRGRKFYLCWQSFRQRASETWEKWARDTMKIKWLKTSVKAWKEQEGSVLFAHYSSSKIQAIQWGCTNLEVPTLMPSLLSDVTKKRFELFIFCTMEKLEQVPPLKMRAGRSKWNIQTTIFTLSQICYTPKSALSLCLNLNWTWILH